MKSVLISIQPKWCELIASGKKTVEVRKTRPKIDTPFKCYIYCTQGKTLDDILTFAEYKNGEYMGDYYANGNVIGEFVCKTISDVFNPEITIQLFEDGKLDKETFGEIQKEFRDIRKDTALTEDEIEEYLNGKDGYGWHISDLVIYDKPKELSDFRKYISFFDGESISELEESGINNIRLKRPPQSWCYVEGVEGK